MGFDLANADMPRIASRQGAIPRRLRVLCVATSVRTGERLRQALASDSACDFQLESVIGAAAGMERLRDESFDIILVRHEPEANESPLDGLAFVEALRASGAEEPVLMLGTGEEQEFAPWCVEAGGDDYVRISTCTTRWLIYKIARAFEYHQLLRESARLRQIEEQRVTQDHRAAQQVLDEQRALLRDLEGLQPTDKPAFTESELPPRGESGLSNGLAGIDLPLFESYRELLRAYVMMGSGSLGQELNALAELLAAANASPAETMQLHLRVVESLVASLGARSSRHVLARADLLVLEVMVHLADSYRRLTHRVVPTRTRVVA